MIEKKIRHFYNSVQISGDIPEVCMAKLKLLRFAAWTALSLAAVIACSKMIVHLVETAGHLADSKD